MPPNTRRYFEESGQLREGRTPDESREFEALLRSKIGGQFQDLVTPENIGLMSLIGRPDFKYNYRGLNYPQGLDSPEETEFMREDLSTVLRSANQELPEGKRIFGLGSEADARLYAHELRHEKMGREYINRLMDLMYSSTSLPAYKDNINKAYEYFTDSEKNRKLPFRDRVKIKNAPLEEKERFVLDYLKDQNWILRDAASNRGEKVSFLSRLRSADARKFIDKNFDLNRSGAVGGFKGSKKLPSNVIEYRSKFPFLNFIGRLEEPAVEKKATGGNVEKVYTERKMI
jgi:hypothetical protein